MSSSERLPPKYNRAKTAEFRVLRRSIDQKANRAKIVDRFRKLHEVSSELETVHESQAQPNPKVQGMPMKICLLLSLSTLTRLCSCNFSYLLSESVC